MTEADTDRLAFLQQQDLSDDERKAVANVARYGWHVVHAPECDAAPGWSCTVGLYHSYRHPEIIVTGLKPELAIFLLNACGQRVRGGSALLHGQRQAGLLQNVECELRTADPFWVQELMHIARWLYGTWDFPVLQCVHPDLENHFPWEPDYDARFRGRQPLLYTGADWTPVEQRLLNAWQHPDDGPAWMFPVSRFTGVETSALVRDGKEPVVYVSHDEDGRWQFHGTSDSGQQVAVAVCFHHLTDQDCSLHELAGLPPGWCAWRETPDQSWAREPLPPEEESATTVEQPLEPAGPPNGE